MTAVGLVAVLFAIAGLVDLLVFRPRRRRCAPGEHRWHDIYGDEILQVNSKYRSRCLRCGEKSPRLMNTTPHLGRAVFADPGKTPEGAPLPSLGAELRELDLGGFDDFQARPVKRLCKCAVSTPDRATGDCLICHAATSQSSPEKAELCIVTAVVPGSGRGTVEFNGTPWSSWPIPVDAQVGDIVPLHSTDEASGSGSGW